MAPCHSCRPCRQKLTTIPGTNSLKLSRKPHRNSLKRRRDYFSLHKPGLSLGRCAIALLMGYPNKLNPVPHVSVPQSDSRLCWRSDGLQEAQKIRRSPPEIFRQCAMWLHRSVWI
jgi:hypothetical protein